MNISSFCLVNSEFLNLSIKLFFWKQVKELKVAFGTLSGRSSKFCTDACLRRYLEARNWNVDKAKKMIEETLKWRATYKPEEIHWVSERSFANKLLLCEYGESMRSKISIYHFGSALLLL